MPLTPAEWKSRVFQYFAEKVQSDEQIERYDFASKVLKDESFQQSESPIIVSDMLRYATEVAAVLRWNIESKFWSELERRLVTELSEPMEDWEEELLDGPTEQITDALMTICAEMTREGWYAYTDCDNRIRFIQRTITADQA